MLCDVCLGACRRGDSVPRFECNVRLSEGDPRPSFDVDIGDPDDPSDDTPFEADNAENTAREIAEAGH